MRGEGGGRGGIRTHVNSHGKISSTGSSEEDGTHDAASRETRSPRHYRLSYSGPAVSLQTEMAEEDVSAPYSPAGEKNLDDDNDVLPDV